MKKLFVAIMVLILGACSVLPDVADSPAAVSYKGVLSKQPIEPIDSGFVNGVNNFGFAAAKLLYEQDSNIALSPISIELALCMAREGAAGDTKQELSDTLKLSELSDEQIVEACRLLMWRANTGGMQVSNAIWLLKEYPFSERFVNICTQDYMADAFPLAIPGAKKSVNDWADEKTHGRIVEIFETEPEESTRLILANALYFLGDWEQPFEAKSTYKCEFYSPSETVNTDFMHSDWHVPYYKDDDFSMISLNFKSNEDEGKYAMAFLLPKEGKMVDDMLLCLDAQRFTNALSGAKEQEVLIRLPKYEFKFNSNLNNTLKEMGMTKAFDSQNADFSAMVGKPANETLYIGSVNHVCYIRVDELGAEAAAVTTVDMCGAGAPPEVEPEKFYADRPFVFAIYSVEDGSIAFMGIVNDPTQK